MKSGIYKITCIPTGKVYIGQSKNVKQRFKTHIYSFKSGRNANPYLQRAWDKYGKEGFKFDIVEFCEEEKLDEREVFYFSFYRSCDEEYGYNILRDASWSIALKKRWADPEFKKQMMDKSKDRWENDPEFKERNILAIQKAHEERRARGEPLACLSEEGQRKSKEACRTEEHRELRRQQALKQLKDPKYRNARAEDAKRGWEKGPRAGVTKHNKMQKNDPEYKKAQAEKTRLSWEKIRQKKLGQ